MSELKHTPGPWETVRDNHIDPGYIAGNACRIVFSPQADVAYIPAVDDDNGNANARLIAAAPDLLHALKLVVAFGSKGETDDGQSVSYFTEAAIAKAEGRTRA